ncbi:MAG TPA: hypothetical protein VFT06_14795, partial [Flavisolibacter sp.]|nr:hypothetical protein [Flavisolibacter sp.]
MNRSALLPLAVGAFLTATAFRFVLSSPTPKKAVLQKSVASKKPFAIRCAPAYIPSADESIPLLTGWGDYKWKITTRSDSAQAYFNQGMAMYYAFH